MRLLSSILAIIAGIFLTKWFGIIGPIIAFLASESLICLIIIPKYTLNIIKSNKKYFFNKIVFKSFLIFLIQLSLSYIVYIYLNNVSLKIILLFVNSFIIGYILNYYILFEVNERKKINTIFRLIW